MATSHRGDSEWESGEKPRRSSFGLLGVRAARTRTVARMPPRSLTRRFDLRWRPREVPAPTTVFDASTGVRCGLRVRVEGAVEGVTTGLRQRGERSGLPTGETPGAEDAALVAVTVCLGVLVGGGDLVARLDSDDLRLRRSCQSNVRGVWRALAGRPAQGIAGFESAQAPGLRGSVLAVLDAEYEAPPQVWVRGDGDAHCVALRSGRMRTCAVAPISRPRLSRDHHEQHRGHGPAHADVRRQRRVRRGSRLAAPTVAGPLRHPAPVPHRDRPRQRIHGAPRPGWTSR